MSSLFNHLFIPITILLIFSKRLKIDPRNIILFSFFGILPDADIFLFHRATLHNIFILVIPILIFIFIKDAREISGIICFYLGSHLLLDIFDGGIFLLYPFYKNVFYCVVELIFKDGMIFNMGIGDRIINIKTIGEPMISSENIGVAVLLVITVFISMIIKMADKGDGDNGKKVIL
jgi:hypothetical protein